MTLDIEADGASLVVTDDIEQRQCCFRTPEPVTATPVSGDSFYFPVDAAVRIDSSSITLGNYVATFVRDDEGTVLARVEHADEHTFDEGVYSVELDHAIKLYVQVHGSMHVETTGLTTTIETDGVLFIGARSRHNRPAGTITTTCDPEAIMQAVSALASSLKTTSVERSYPTLRGHPPELVLGDELTIPETLRPSETGIRIEVPPRLRFVYPVASLAFYLGARIVPGESPRLVGDDGFSYDLVGPDGFETTVEQLLRQVFLFDCVARTEGFYKLDLSERHAVDEVVDLDWPTLYDASLTDQLRAYLTVPFDRIEPFVPDWKTTTYLEPTAENVELLPYLVDDLSLIRLPAGESTTIGEVQTSSIFEFTRTGPAGASVPHAATESGFTRSVSTRSSETGQQPTGLSLVRPAAADSYEVIWAAESMPVGATKASIDGYRNGLRHSPSDEIGVTVVVNDEAMAAEGAVASDIYGEDAEFPLDLRVYENLTTDALKAVLETERDFLHYIGHIEADGFECADGRLDARDLTTVGIDAFFLNACASYEQGMALLEAGAVGGVVTISEVLNSGATLVGESMVNLLNHGFPLRAALELAKQSSFVGGQYAIVGDGDVDIVQREGLGAGVIHLQRRGEQFGITLENYPTNTLSVGGFGSVSVDDSGRYYLSPGKIGEFSLSRGKMKHFLQSVGDPIWYDGELCWPGELEL